MRRFALMATAALIVLAPACKSNKTLAVFDLQDRAGLLTDDQRAQLSEHLAGAMGQGGKQQVLPRARTQGLCPDLDPDCLAAKAAALEVGGYLTARVLKLGPGCSLVLKFFRLKDKAARLSTAVQSACDPAGLVTAIDLAAIRLLSPDPGAEQREAEAAVRARVQREEDKRRELELQRAEQELARQAEEARKLLLEAKQQAGSTPPEEPGPQVEAAPTEDIQEGKGRVLINAEPPAKVFADGRLVGQTPMIIDLAAGRHRLAFEGPDGRRMDREVEVKAGEESHLEVRLPEAPEGSPSEGLPSEVVLRIVKQHRQALASCLDLHPKRAQPGPLKIGLALTISPSGKVSKVEIPFSGVPAPVRTCLMKKARRWRFPASRGGPVNVKLPIVLQR